MLELNRFYSGAFIEQQKIDCYVGIFGQYELQVAQHSNESITGQKLIENLGGIVLTGELAQASILAEAKVLVTVPGGSPAGACKVTLMSKLKAICFKM